MHLENLLRLGFQRIEPLPSRVQVRFTAAPKQVFSPPLILSITFDGQLGLKMRLDPEATLHKSSFTSDVCDHARRCT